MTFLIPKEVLNIFLLSFTKTKRNKQKKKNPTNINQSLQYQFEQAIYWQPKIYENLELKIPKLGGHYTEKNWNDFFPISGSQLAKMKKSIPDMSLP